MKVLSLELKVSEWCQQWGKLVWRVGLSLIIPEPNRITMHVLEAEIAACILADIRYQRKVVDFGSPDGIQLIEPDTVRLTGIDLIAISQKGCGGIGSESADPAIRRYPVNATGTRSNRYY